MPVPLVDPAQSLGPPLTDLIRKTCPEAIDPRTDTLVTHVDAALMQQIFDISKRQRKSDIHQHA